EQLRFIRHLFDLTKPDGLLVLETATARRPRTRNEHCVELWFPPDKTLFRPYHVSTNITHLPSRRAVESWLRMVGFTHIEQSSCPRRISRSLALGRAAFLARKTPTSMPATYYAQYGGFRIGCAR